MRKGCCLVLGSMINVPVTVFMSVLCCGYEMNFEKGGVKAERDKA